MTVTAGNCLLKIEDEPYMSHQQQKYFHAKLLNWRREICASLKQTGLPEQSEAGRFADWIDEASIQSQAELSWAARERALRIIKEIDAALQRIENGIYGFCVETGEEIGIRRLIAMPIARFSVDAQQQHELRLKLYR